MGRLCRSSFVGQPQGSRRAANDLRQEEGSKEQTHTRAARDLGRKLQGATTAEDSSYPHQRSLGPTRGANNSRSHQGKPIAADTSKRSQQLQIPAKELAFAKSGCGKGPDRTDREAAKVPIYIDQGRLVQI